MAAKRSGSRGGGTAAAFAALGLAAAGLAAGGCAPEIVPDREDAAAEEAGAAAPASPVRRAPVAPAPGTGEAGTPAAEDGSEISFTMVRVRAGAEVEIELIDPITAGERGPGDRFRAGVVRPMIENNMVLVPLNSLVQGEITALEMSGEEEVLVKVRFLDVFFNGRAWPMSASVVTVNPAGLQALSADGPPEPILGRVLGAARPGSVVGAAASAAPGTAILLSVGEGADAEPGLPAGAILRLRLDEPLVFGIPAM